MMCIPVYIREFDDESDDFADNFYHEWYYALNAECEDGTIMFSTVDHYREIMEKFDTWKYLLIALGGGTITMYRLWDKYSQDDEDYEPEVDCVWEVYPEEEDEEMVEIDDD